MSHKKDIARAEQGLVFREGKLLKKSELQQREKDTLREMLKAEETLKTLKRLGLLFARPKVRSLK